MSIFENLEKAITETIEGTSETKEKTYLGCPCGFVFQHEGMPPKECPSCMAEVKFTHGKTPAEIKSKMIKEKAKTVVKFEEENKTEEESAKEKRLKAIKSIIERKKINEVSPVAVGQGTIDAPGFTAWKNNKPETVFFEESFDTPESFRAAYFAAREKSTNVQMDSFRVTRLSKELHELSFRGVITVNRNNGYELIKAKPGDVIEIGALKTAKNAIIFVAMKNKGVLENE